MLKVLPQSEWMSYILFYYLDTPIKIGPDLEKYVVLEKLLNGQTFNYLDRTKWITAVQPNLYICLGDKSTNYLEYYYNTGQHQFGKEGLKNFDSIIKNDI